MVARRQVAQEFIPADAEREAQVVAGRLMAQNPEPEVPEEDPDDIILANVIADLGGPGIDAKVNVYQLDQNRNKAFVRAYMPAEFSLEAIQSEYGPGDYEVHVRREGKLATRKVVKIATPKNRPQNVAPTVDQTKIIETMQAGFERMGAMFSAALSGLATNQPKQKTTMEMLQEMQLMREVMMPHQSQSGPNPMEVFELAASIAEKIHPREGEPGAGEVILEAIKNFGPLLGKVAAQGMPPAPVTPVVTGTRPALPTVPIVSPDTPPVVSPAPQPDQPTQPEDDMSIVRRMYLNLLVSNAKAGNDPVTYANLALDIVGEDQALAFVSRPDWYERLCAEDARIRDHRQWFEDLRAAIYDLTKPDEDDIKAVSPPQPAT